MENKFYRYFKDGKIVYRMVDERTKEVYVENEEGRQIVLY